MSIRSLLAVAAAASSLALPTAVSAQSETEPEHVFPVQAPHTTRGAIGEFGAPRSGGRVHEGFDIVAKCGAKLVAVHDGTILRRGFDPVLYGNYLLIKGAAENQNYFYSHLVRPAEVKIGQQVTAGQFVGNEGKTGNAESTGCHLHFEIRRGGRSIDPEPLLRKWDRVS